MVRYRSPAEQDGEVLSIAADADVLSTRDLDYDQVPFQSQAPIVERMAKNRVTHILCQPCGPIWMASLINLCIHVTKNVILVDKENLEICFFSLFSTSPKKLWLGQKKLFIY